MSVPRLRTVDHSVRTEPHGPIRRLIGPDDLGERLKPFIFLDYFDSEIEPGFGFAMHPHSGIATLTWQPGCDVRYRDTTGMNGTLRAGGLEWMNAGGGAWHEGRLLGRGRVIGFQLWVPMPPGVEDGAPLGQYVPPEEVPVLAFPGGSVTVLLGGLTGADGVEAASPIRSHQDMTYLVLRLDAGRTWRHAPPRAHDVAWTFGFEGEPLVNGRDGADALVVLGEDGDIEITAPKGEVRVLIGTARRYPHPLVLGPSSVHTNLASLERATARIREIGAQLT